MVEKWNIGCENRMMPWLYFLINLIYMKTDLIPQTQHSSIPLFQYPKAFDYGIRLGGLPLTWLKESFFRC